MASRVKYLSTQFGLLHEQMMSSPYEKVALPSSSQAFGYNIRPGNYTGIGSESYEEDKTLKEGPTSGVHIIEKLDGMVRKKGDKNHVSK